MAPEAHGLPVQLARLLVHNDASEEAHDRMLVPLLPPFQASIGEEYVSLAMASVLDPVQRNLELIASLLMTMSYTATVQLFGDYPVSLVLLLTLGCNVAWGCVDAAYYLISTFTGRARQLSQMRRLRDALRKRRVDARALRRLVSEFLPDGVGDIDDEQVRALAGWIAHAADPHASPTLTRRDWCAALSVVCIVVFATFPVVIPFTLFPDNVQLAVTVSHCIALAILLVSGCSFGLYGGMNPLLSGLITVSLGVVIVGIVVSLNGGVGP